MRFQVPQFINIEDRIFGPLTVKQFIYVTGGAGLVSILYKLLPFYLAIFAIAPVAALAIALAFVKINSRPFVLTLEAALKYIFGNRLYLWKKRPKKPKTPEEEARVAAQVPPLSERKLKDLTFALDINQNVKKK